MRGWVGGCEGGGVGLERRAGGEGAAYIQGRAGACACMDEKAAAGDHRLAAGGAASSGRHGAGNCGSARAPVRSSASWRGAHGRPPAQCKRAPRQPAQAARPGRRRAQAAAGSGRSVCSLSGRTDARQCAASLSAPTRPGPGARGELSTLTALPAAAGACSPPLAACHAMPRPPGATPISTPSH